ncbi:hypothetical protein Poly59_61300 [Rubripirellula reticaptiva]|uniref:Uncharacterized protein n=1 Tax=Rubripirellula reticaptiva TaxID=2528013 RepID=A0A5C6E9G4_9BACT|nr:hypothetical protein Poly59_61300 [Rubripirellula reticaptiva]
MSCTRSTACAFSQMESCLSVPGDDRRSLDLHTRKDSICTRLMTRIDWFLLKKFPHATLALRCRQWLRLNTTLQFATLPRNRHLMAGMANTSLWLIIERTNVWLSFSNFAFAPMFDSAGFLTRTRFPIIHYHPLGLTHIRLTKLRTRLGSANSQNSNLGIEIAS